MRIRVIFLLDGYLLFLQNRIWERDGEIVAFCFYENPGTDIYFCLKPGYEKLVFEMAQYADELDFPLPEGFHFVKPQDIDRSNVGKCRWKGFDHEQCEGSLNLLNFCMIHNKTDASPFIRYARFSFPHMAAALI